MGVARMVLRSPYRATRIPDATTILLMSKIILDQTPIAVISFICCRYHSEK